MSTYIVYNVTGQIIISGQCPDGEEVLYKGSHHVFIGGCYNPDEYYMSTLGIVAVGTITMSGIATVNETFIIGTQTFTWKNARSGTGEVTIGASASEAVTNIVTSITADLTTVTASDGAGDTVVVTAVATGVAGNSIIFSESSTNMAMDGSGFLGGTTAGVDPTISGRPLLTTVATWNKTTIYANGTDAATLGTGLPNPTEISIQIVTALGAEAIAPFNATTGSFILKSLIVGTYSVTARAFPYKDYTITITAVAP